MGQTAKALREAWRKHYRRTLDLVFEEFASRGITVWPDEAMVWMEELLGRMVSDGQQTTPAKDPSGPVNLFRFNKAAYDREAHHYAVDRFYKTYFPRKRGGEPLPAHYVDEILRLMRKGLNYVAIAKRLGQPKDRMRKQVDAAEKRWRDAVERIERIKQRSPHLVAPDPRPQGEQLTARQQSKRQGKKRRAGK